MRVEREVERLRAENGELRRRLVAVEQQLATALERVVELEAQLGQRRDPPACVKTVLD